MTRKFTMTAAALTAVTGAAILALAGSGYTSSTRIDRGESTNTSATRLALTRDALLHATKVTDARPPESSRIRTAALAPLSLTVRSAVVPAAPAGADGQVEGDENSNPASTKLMTNHGGAVQTSPHIYLVFWGPSWFTGGDPYGVANRLNSFYSGISGSSWANVLKQYGSAYGSFSNPAGQYVGWIQDTTPVPASPSMTDMANAALRAAARIGDRSYNAQYVIATPWGVIDQKSANEKACGWHKYTYVNSTQWVTYTSLPYTPYLDAYFKSQGTSCGGGYVNGSAGVLDGVTINAGHEYAETVTDPSGYTWYDTDGSENADKCSWKNLANKTFANGMTFPVQPTWSNVWRTQYGYGCYYSN